MIYSVVTRLMEQLEMRYVNVGAGDVSVVLCFCFCFCVLSGCWRGIFVLMVEPGYTSCYVIGASRLFFGLVFLCGWFRVV